MLRMTVRCRPFFRIASLAMFSGVIAAANLANAHDHGPAGDPVTSVGVGLGTVHFITSGSPRARPDFVRGMLLLHSFEYPAARSAFQAAEKIDPSFVMAYWGEALTYNQTLWGEQNLQAARSVLAELGATPAERAGKAKTVRERQYLASVEQLYGEGTKAQRDAHYSEALGALSREFPADLDARALYSLSLLGLTNGVRNEANYMRAAAEAEAVYDVDRHHPGALHYLIHAYDDPIHAPLGLRAARLYGTVAPDAPHALHMPSHIYFALGMWDEAIATNIASLRVAREHHDGGYHSLVWLVYAYLQEDRRQEAEQLMQSVARDVEAGPTKDNRIRLAHLCAIWRVETGGAEASGVPANIDSAGITSIGYFNAMDFAVGIAPAATDSERHAALVRMRARADSANSEERAVKADWHDNVTATELAQATIMAEALEGTITYHGGDRATGVAQIRAAIARAEHEEFEYGPPWSVKPLDELLGDLLLADGRREEAAVEYQKTLAVYPQRRLARAGLAASQVAK